MVVAAAALYGGVLPRREPVVVGLPGDVEQGPGRCRQRPGPLGQGVRRAGDDWEVSPAAPGPYPREPRPTAAEGGPVRRAARRVLYRRDQDPRRENTLREVRPKQHPGRQL